MSVPLTVREATIDDAEGVAAIAAESWTDREETDYLPRVFPEWLEKDRARTYVAAVTDDAAIPADAPAVAGIAQVVMLSADEAWAQGMRVHPAYRGEGVGSRIVEECFDWAREQGATVARNMVFSWNGAGLGQSRATGFEPATELRFASPTPSPDADPSEHGPAAHASDDAEAVVDADAAWRYWTHSEAREHFTGLVLDGEESWAVRELTRGDLEAAADDGGAIAIRTGDGTVAMGVRSRVDTRRLGDASGEGDGGRGDEGDTETVAYYGATAWDDLDACAALVAAIAADAASVDADRTKVQVPETVRHVSDLAACRVEIGDEPDFVLAADLTDGE